MEKVNGNKKNLVKVKVTDGKIRLDRFLKWSGVAQTGGQAKYMIENGHVKVNKKIETGRTKVLETGDIVEGENFGPLEVVNSE
ncbi:MAG: RNA-binding S4 domain-containing protein [Bacillota bacterium]